VRLGRYVLFELLIAAAGLCALAVGARVGGGALLERLAARGAAGEGAAAGYATRIDPPSPADPPLVGEPAGTFLGMADELLLERIGRQPIVRMKLNKGGSSLSFRVDFADGSRAAFKPAQTNLQTVPRKEVAAYRLNRLLGLNAVPPAAPRLVSRDELFSRLHPDSLPAVPRIRAETIFNPFGKTAGVVSYWIPEIKDSGLDTPEGRAESAAWLLQGSPIPPEKQALAAQVSNLIVFDFLTSNPDRYSGGNMKMSPDGARLYFMDNTLSFHLDPQGPERNRAILQQTQRFSRRLYAALGRVTTEGLEEALSEATGGDPYEILTPAEIRAVVARRAVIQGHVDALVSTYGAANVLVFP
jgi:hypothetical protein